MAGKGEGRRGGRTSTEGEREQEEWATPSGTPTEKKRGRPLRADLWIKERSSSDGSLDSWKRKRQEDQGKRGEEQGEGESAFKRSALTRRSPAREEETEGEAGMESMMTEMMGMMREMKEEMARLRGEVEEGRKEAREGIQEIRAEIEGIKADCDKEREKGKRKIGEMEERLKKLEKGGKDKEGSEAAGQEKRGALAEKVDGIEKEWEKRERRERKNNVIIKGKEVEKEGRAREVSEAILRGVLGKDADVEEVQDIGRDRRMILVKLNSWEEKREVMGSKTRLKGRHIFIEDDLTRKEREIQTKLWDRAREEREKGNRTKVGYQKMRIGEETWE